MIRRVAVLLLCAAFAGPVQAATTTVAVAANFAPVLKTLLPAFTDASGHHVRIVIGATGQLYAQIVNGAPYDALLAADQARPAQLVADGIAPPEGRFTYARGRLALCSRNLDLTGVSGIDLLRTGNFARLAVANANTAPYGAAALALLSDLGVAERLAPRLVRGENVAQTLQFVVTGSVDAGIVALAQAQAAARHKVSCTALPDANGVAIHQDAVLLAHGKDNPATRALLTWLQSDSVQRQLQHAGYAALR